MMKLSYSPIWILFSYLTVACNNSTSAHKNTDTKLKSVTTIVSTTELKTPQRISLKIFRQIAHSASWISL